MNKTREYEQPPLNPHAQRRARLLIPPGVARMRAFAANVKPEKRTYMLACRNGHTETRDTNIERQENRRCSVCGAEVVWSYSQTEVA